MKRTKALQWILTAVGSLLLLDGIIVAARSNFSLGILLTVILGIAVLLWGVFYKKISSLTAKGPLMWCKRLILLGLCCFLTLSCFLACYGVLDNADYTEDAVIVLGAGVHGRTPSLHLRRRLDRAVLYSRDDPDALIVVSGGQGFQENVTEALAMKEYLLACNVPEERILMEEKAVSTEENFRFSKEILDKRFDGNYTVAYITNDFHVFRAGLMAKKAGFSSITHVHSYTDWYTYPQNYLRESLAVLKTLLLG